MGDVRMSYTPRLDDTGILDNFHWYSENPFYLAGYGMPNCTCYAWGRFWEIGDPYSDGSHKPNDLPTSDGGDWWQDALDSGVYETGQLPKLGAVICFSDNLGGAGHVAIVEEINQMTNEITCSNSAYGGTYFFLSYITPDSLLRYDWSHYTFQGFIYNPYADEPSTPIKKKRFPWVLFANKIRQKRRGL